MKKMTIQRQFDAPIHSVWDAFTKSEILIKWWSPSGMHCSHASVELEEGGQFLYCFEGSEGTRFWGQGKYQKITSPGFLSYKDTFADQHGKPVPPSYYGIPGDEILESLVEIHFTEEGSQTSMKIVMDNHYDDSMTEALTQGWNSMFDKLTSIL